MNWGLLRHSRLGIYVLRRALALLPQLLAISTVTFVLARLLPGDPVGLILGPMATPESLAKLRSEMHLDQPLYIQYYYYVSNVLHGDFGRSWSTSDSVWNDLIERVPATLELITYSLVLALIMGIAIGSRGVPHGWLGRPCDPRLWTDGWGDSGFLAWTVAHFLFLLRVADLSRAARPA